ncbi:G-protein coupled receptor Mth2-like [Periplaneta americana]|uniref:G-protein coupled receptor Mth2-like n=1 Tax=Periplaneta americana TaxID=6978 RepID=UPI0037E86BA9
MEWYSVCVLVMCAVTGPVARLAEGTTASGKSTLADNIHAVSTNNITEENGMQGRKPVTEAVGENNLKVEKQDSTTPGINQTVPTQSDTASASEIHEDEKKLGSGLSNLNNKDSKPHVAGFINSERGLNDSDSKDVQLSDENKLGLVSDPNVTNREMGQESNANTTKENMEVKIITMTSRPISSETVTNGIGDFYAVNEEDLNKINSTRACNPLLSVVIQNWTLFDNGSLLSMDDSPFTYPSGYFWKEVNEDNITEVWGCVCELRNCIRKCCPEGMTTSGDECYPSNFSLLHPFKPDFIDENMTLARNVSVYTLYGIPCPDDSFRLDPVEDGGEQYELHVSGVLRVPADGNFTVADYCIEAFEDTGGILPLLCFPPMEEFSTEDNEDSDIYLLYPVGMIISVPFLFATFFVYAVIPELRNLHGKSLMCHVSSLFTAYVFLAVVQLGGSQLSIGFCIVCAFIIFFAFHANFFWLNVMCFDIWWTFSGLRPLRGSVKERERKKFLMYSVYAWGSPLIMLIVCLLMDLLPGIPDTYIKPEFGVKKCWFRTDTAILAYFFGPIGVLVLCNIVLFITTAIKIVKLKRETRMLKGSESKRHDDEANRQRFNLYLKLFVVMGVNWIMEVISWATGGPNYLWYITDFGNTLQGLLIFIIFVCKQKVGRLLVKRFCPKLAGPAAFDNSTRFRPTPSRTSSYNYTQRTSVSINDQVDMRPIGTYRTSVIP